MEQVVRISDKIQVWRGERYYLCGFYFQRNGARLHRKVWTDLHGTIPRGHHVHHVDGDRANNQPRNLECVSTRDHLGHHSKGKPHSKAVAAMQAKAKLWHGSAEGRAWHGKMARRNFAALHIRDVERACDYCGKPYLTTRGCAKRSRFCHLNCKMAALRRRRGVREGKRRGGYRVPDGG